MITWLKCATSDCDLESRNQTFAAGGHCTYPHSERAKPGLCKEDDKASILAAKSLIWVRRRITARLVYGVSSMRTCAHRTTTVVAFVGKMSYGFRPMQIYLIGQRLFLGLVWNTYSGKYAFNEGSAASCCALAIKEVKLSGDMCNRCVKGYSASDRRS